MEQRGVPFVTYLPQIFQGLQMLAGIFGLGQPQQGGGQLPYNPYGMQMMNEETLIAMLESQAKQARESAKGMEAYADQLEGLIKKLKED